MEITQAELKEILHYDPETGIFRWRYSVARKVKPWDVAGTTTFAKYCHIKINGKNCKAHRVAWLYMTCEWPVEQIDHKDGVKSNNSWKNLRLATNKQNMENQSLRKNNTSGCGGVTWRPDAKKWRARIGHGYNRIHVGYFETFEQASSAIVAKKAEIYTHYTGRDQVNFARFE